LDSSEEALFEGLADVPGPSDPALRVAGIPTGDGLLKKGLNYSHEAMLDFIIANPFAGGEELSKHFGYSRSWISTVLCSDAFQSRLAERREQLVDPQLRMTLEEQARGLFARSMEVLREKFDQPSKLIPYQLALQTFAQSARALGYGVRETRVSVSETHVHLEELGNNLVNLLRRRRTEIEGEVVEVPLNDKASQTS